MFRVTRNTHQLQKKNNNVHSPNKIVLARYELGNRDGLEVGRTFSTVNYCGPLALSSTSEQVPHIYLIMGNAMCTTILHIKCTTKREKDTKKSGSHTQGVEPTPRGAFFVSFSLLVVHFMCNLVVHIAFPFSYILKKTQGNPPHRVRSARASTGYDKIPIPTREGRSFSLHPEPSLHTYLPWGYIAERWMCKSTQQGLA